MSKGQNVEWDKMPNGHKVESKKGQMGHNVEWDKTPNGNHIESKKGRLGQNVERYKKNLESKQCRIRRQTVSVEKGLKMLKVRKCCCSLKKILDTTLNNNVKKCKEM